MPIQNPKRKPPPKKIHYCSQEETIKRLSYIIVGNGTPESGLAFKMAQSMEDRKDLHNKLNYMESALDRANEKQDGLLLEITGIRGSLEVFKANILSYNKGEVSAEAKQIAERDMELKVKADKRAHQVKRLQTLGIVIAAISLLITSVFTVLNHSLSSDNNKVVKSTDEKVDLINTPVVTRSGSIYLEPAGLLIDSIKKAIKKDSIK